jgi:sirohydrochlorin ferrochelatase
LAGCQPAQQKNTGIIVFAHGSRVESANEAVRSVSAELARASGFLLVQAAFLELGQPDLLGAADQLVAKGAERLIVLPYFLTLGLHMERDLPVLIAAIKKKYKDLDVEVSAPLDGHPALVQILLDRFLSILRSRNS